MKDKIIPYETTSSSSVLVFGGEYYFPPNTGLFSNFCFGADTVGLAAYLAVAASMIGSFPDTAIRLNFAPNPIRSV